MSDVTDAIAVESHEITLLRAQIADAGDDEIGALIGRMEADARSRMSHAIERAQNRCYRELCELHHIATLMQRRGQTASSATN